MRRIANLTSRGVPAGSIRTVDDLGQFRRSLDTTEAIGIAADLVDAPLLS